MCLEWCFRCSCTYIVLWLPLPIVLGLIRTYLLGTLRDQRSVNCLVLDVQLGLPVVPFLTPFFGKGSPTKIDYRNMRTLILTYLVVDLVNA